MRAPGRVNLIGEHTDYSSGYLLSFAIDRCTEVALKPRNDRKVRVFAKAFQDAGDLSIPMVHAVPTGGWQNYLTGILIKLSKVWSIAIRVRGGDHGNIPTGAGLSSSAALEVALAVGLTRLYEIELDDLDLIALCQRTESEFVGTKRGIMDQYASLLAQENTALFLDVASLKHHYVPLLLEGLALLVVDSNLRRSLTQSGYNKRWQECQEALRWLKNELPDREIPTLRAVDQSDLERVAGIMPNPLWGRALHVITENERVLRAASALERGAAAEVGRLLFASHASLRDLFQASTPQLDFLVEWAESNGAVGAWLVGGGFGGVTLHLIATDDKEVITQT